MPNDKFLYLITGPKSLLEAANQELNLVLLKIDNPQPWADCLWLSTVHKNRWWGEQKNALGGQIPLTLPQDWDQLMTILEDLKKPKVPEYVRAGLNNRVFKVFDTIPRNDGNGPNLKVYNTYGKEDQVACLEMNGYTPITEQEFIQGGLKELEEAGFVVGAKTKGSLPTDREYKVGAVEYLHTGTYGASPHSPLTLEEVIRVGFCFTIKGEGWSIPVGQCTLLPKPLPTTICGIPYHLDRDNLYLGHQNVPGYPVLTLKASMLRYLMRNGVTGLVTTKGHLVKEDLTKILSV